jgi:tetratricopeptide (TPR) repeat protein
MNFVTRVLATAVVTVSSLALAQAQTTGRQSGAAASTKVDKAAAYYYFSLGHLYSDLASQFNNRGDYLNKAIENFRLAMKADASATFLADELAELYIQSGRLREAVSEFEGAVKDNPNDLPARRILGRVYARMIGDPQQNRVREDMVKKAIEQYQKIAEADPKDVDTLLMLGRLNKVAQNSAEAEKAYKKALDVDPGNEDAMTGLAVVYSDLGDNKGAAEMLRKVSEKSPNARNLFQLANAYEQMRDYSLAAQALRKAIALNPPNVGDFKRALAQDLLLADQLDDALKTYQDLVSEEPNDVLSWLRISQIHRQRRAFDKAREAAAKAKAIDGSNMEVRYNDVSLYEAEGRTDEAIKTLKEMVDSTSRRNYNPAEKAQRVTLLERLGVLYRTHERTQDAVDAFRQIGELDPDLANRAAAQVVETLRQGREYAKAEKESEAAASKFPQDRMVLLTRASVLADSGKISEAVAVAKKLLNGKDDRETYITLAQLYEKAKKYDDMGKALDEADKLADSKEDKVNTAFMRGAMFEKLKKYDQAEGEFRKVLASDPDNTSALNYLGYMLVDRNVRVQEAYEMIKKAVDKEPTNGAYLDSLGWAYFRLGKLDEAENYLKQALEQTKRDPAVHDHIAEVYAKKGNLKQAIVHWEIAIKEWDRGAPADLDQAEYAKVQKKLERARVKVSSQKP